MDLQRYEVGSKLNLEGHHEERRKKTWMDGEGSEVIEGKGCSCDAMSRMLRLEAVVREGC